MIQITCDNVLPTLSMDRAERDIEELFLIKYSTANNCMKINIDNQKNGYRRFMIELLSRLNFNELNKLQNGLKNKQEVDELAISTIIKMPLVKVREYKESLVTWKIQFIELLESMDKRILQKQRDIIYTIIKSRQEGIEYEKENACGYKGAHEKINIPFELSQEQILKGNKASPTKEQIDIANKIALKKGKKIPPIVKKYAVRLQRWATKTSLRQDIDVE